MNKNSRMLAGVLFVLAATVAPLGATPQSGSRPMHPGPMGSPPGAAATVRPGAPPVASAYSSVPVKKTSAGEQFFIVASLDLQKSQLLLKYPTEVTLLVKATPQTQFADDSGKPIKISDLRAGDTVWVTLSGGADSTAASKVRKGQMTVAQLHRFYLDYSEIK